MNKTAVFSSRPLIMKIKKLSFIAAVIGSLCIVYAFWVQDVSVPILAGIPPTGGSFDSKFFWRPLCAGIMLWALAGGGFIWCKRRHHGPALPDDGSSVKR
jgi:hypothetical protein